MFWSVLSSYFPFDLLTLTLHHPWSWTYFLFQPFLNICLQLFLQSCLSMLDPTFASIIHAFIPFSLSTFSPSVIIFPALKLVHKHQTMLSDEETEPHQLLPQASIHCMVQFRTCCSQSHRTCFSFALSFKYWPFHCSSKAVVLNLCRLKSPFIRLKGPFRKCQLLFFTCFWVQKINRTILLLKRAKKDCNRLECF